MVQCPLARPMCRSRVTLSVRIYNLSGSTIHIHSQWRSCVVTATEMQRNMCHISLDNALFIASCQSQLTTSIWPHKRILSSHSGELGPPSAWDKDPDVLRSQACKSGHSNLFASAIIVGHVKCHVICKWQALMGEQFVDSDPEIICL